MNTDKNILRMIHSACRNGKRFHRYAKPVYFGMGYLHLQGILLEYYFVVKLGAFSNLVVPGIPIKLTKF